MSTITKSHLRRLTATILIGCVVLLPALIGRAPAHHGAVSTDMTLSASASPAL